MKQHTNFSWWKRCTTAATCGSRVHALLALLLLLIPPPLRTSACLLRRLLSRHRSPPSPGARLPPAAPRNPSLTHPAPCGPLHAPPTAAKDQWGHLYREARASPPRAIPCPLHLPRAPPHDAHHRVVFPHTTTLTTGAAFSLLCSTDRCTERRTRISGDIRVPALRCFIYIPRLGRCPIQPLLTVDRAHTSSLYTSAPASSERERRTYYSHRSTA